MSETYIVKLSELEGGRRLDVEYYKPTSVNFRNMLRRKANCVALGDCVEHGCRVVYQNTKTIPRSKRSPTDVLFLQATNIWNDLPIIAEECVSYVRQSDWVKYPKGQIIPNEILVEVKGKAEKVVLVPYDIPLNILVSGSLYKLTIKDGIEPEYILIYLLSKFGKKIRDSAKTNLLISFVRKDYLYSLPVVLLHKQIRCNIKKLYRQFYKKISKARDLLVRADRIILNELGLDQHEANHTAFVKQSSVLINFKRWDAEFFDPGYDSFLKKITKYKNGYMYLLDVVDNIRASYSPSLYHNQKFTYTEISSINSTMGTISSMSDVVGSEAPSRATRLLQKNDVLVSRLSGSFSSIALVNSSDSNMLASSGFFQFRAINIPSELLFVLARTIIQIQNKKEASGAIMSAVPDRNLVRYVIPNFDKPLQKKIVKLVIKSFKLYYSAKQSLDDAIKILEDGVTHTSRK